MAARRELDLGNIENLVPRARFGNAPALPHGLGGHFGFLAHFLTARIPAKREIVEGQQILLRSGLDACLILPQDSNWNFGDTGLKDPFLNSGG